MPNNAEAARKRRMEGRVCGNCGHKADEMRSWNRGPFGGIAICRICAAVLDLTTYLNSGNFIWDAFEAGLSAAAAGEPCSIPDKWLESRIAAFCWVDGWVTLAKEDTVPLFPVQAGDSVSA